jgi:hypothetical protein
MEIENLLGWEHTLQISNQLIKHNIATILSCLLKSIVSIKYFESEFLEK